MSRRFRGGAGAFARAWAWATLQGLLDLLDGLFYVSRAALDGLFDLVQGAGELSGLGAQTGGLSYNQAVSDTLDDLADHLEKHMDLDGLLQVAEQVSP